MTSRVLCSLALLLVSFLAKAQSSAVPNNSTLTIPQIMQGDRFVGFLPSNISWSEDSETIYFSWNPEMDTIRSLYKTDRNGSEPVPVPTEEQKMLRNGNGDYSADRAYKVYTDNGDLFLLNRATGEEIQLTNTTDRESGPFFAREDQVIVYRSGNDLFSWDRQTGAIGQLTNVQSDGPRRSRPDPEYQQWLQEQQMDLFEVLRWRETQSEARSAQREALQPDRPSPVYLEGKRLWGMEASDDLRYVTMMMAKSADAKNTRVPNYVTQSGYIEDLRSRAKVGSPQTTYEMGVFDRERDTFYRIDPAQLPGIYDKPAYLEEYHTGTEDYVDTFKQAREVTYASPIFNGDGEAILILRSQDNKDRWITLLDPVTGELTTLDHQRDDAWIAGPGIGWSFASGTAGWLPGNRTIYYQSEASGYSHLYILDTETGKKTQLTSGEYEVQSAALSNDGSTFYITASAEGPHEHHFYHLPVGGGALTRITTMPGNHEVDISPDEEYLAIRYSYSNNPWELYVMPNEAGAEAVRVTESTTEDFNAYDWREPEIVRFTARDGAEVPARLYRPENPQPNGPAVIFVHGAGYLQNVHRWWSSYYREYMFHNLLVDNGYTVLDIDYRASAGYGRDWRTGIYRHMGGKDLDDQVDGAKYLAEAYDIDPDRIGIYGGSYGGFITLMALFTEPGTFAAGAALRSVTDWAHYNHGYTSNILNTPTMDSIAYARSSPINFADGLDDRLLILHGMIDTNVQFQDVVRLAQRLIELEKDNWEFAVFPVERHGFIEPTSWSDEYKRIFKLFQETLK
jgi:dipeptidyl aminopeptidase/acylaminoacyl peptidase